MNIGIFAIDPGGNTGIAWGVFDPTVEVGEALRERMLAGSATVQGDARSQIREVVSIWQSFYRTCVESACLPPENIWIVCEDYIFTGQNVYAGESASISTALIWGIEGYRMGQADEWKRHKRGKLVMPSMIMQTASDAKGYATNIRIKEWGLWVVGRDHERSAHQHIAYFLKKYKDQHVG